MPTGALPLADLAKRLSRKENEVDRLRRQYETRLGRLRERQQQLENELRDVEGQILAASANGSVSSELPEEPIATAANRMILKDFLVALINEAGKPLTVKELAEEVRRRKYPTKSKNIPDLVQVRVYDMVKNGVLAHASGGPGFVVNGRQTKAVRGKKGRKPKAQVRASRGTQPPLREVLTKILESCEDPIGGGELAEMALKTGYKSTSKNFSGVVYVSLAQMKNVERIHGKGYRLKR